jgi:uncharacterized protein (TIGR02145 family)
MTYAVPVPAIAGDAYASSIAFEMERQYTFQFELSGRKPIEYKGVKVSNYKDVVQEELLNLQWAGSNIYWDGSKLTFDDSSIKINKEHQGVLFKWGSLVGMSPARATGNSTGWAGLTYYPTNPGVDTTWTTDAALYSDYALIPYVSGDPGSYLRTNAYLTTITNDPDSVAASKGDICVYLTKIGAAPKGKRWRMPTSAEFKALADYERVPADTNTAFAAVSNQTADGATNITNGWQRKDLNTPYFPASGFRNTAGTLGVVGTNGYYWSSSPASNVVGFYLGFTGTTVGTANNSYGSTYGFAIRCVTE